MIAESSVQTIDLDELVQIGICGDQEQLDKWKEDNKIRQREHRKEKEKQMFDQLEPMQKLVQSKNDFNQIVEILKYAYGIEEQDDG